MPANLTKFKSYNHLTSGDNPNMVHRYQKEKDRKPRRDNTRAKGTTAEIADRVSSYLTESC